MIALGDLVSRAIIVPLGSSIFFMAIKTAESRLVCAVLKAASCFYPYVTHVINFTRLPRFSACNIEKRREPGDKAIPVTCTRPSPSLRVGSGNETKIYETLCNMRGSGRDKHFGVHVGVACS